MIYDEFFAGKDFIMKWTNSADTGVYNDAYYVGLIVLIPLTVSLTQSAAGVSVLQAINKFSVRAVIMFAAAIFNIVVSIILVDVLKPYNMAAIGAGIGTLVTTLAGHLIAMNIYFKKKCDIGVGRYFASLFKGLLPAMLVTFVVGMLINMIPIWSISWLSIAMRAVIVALVYFATMFLFGFNDYEKNLFIAPLLKVKRKLISR